MDNDVCDEPSRAGPGHPQLQTLLEVATAKILLDGYASPFGASGFATCADVIQAANDRGIAPDPARVRALVMAIVGPNPEGRPAAAADAASLLARMPGGADGI